MVPNEDTGTIMGAVTLPPGTSQERAQEILNRVDSLLPQTLPYSHVPLSQVIASWAVKDLLTVHSSSS